MNPLLNRSIYPAWGLAGGASIVMGMVAVMSISAYGIYLGPLEREFGWSQTTIGIAFAFTFAVSAPASILVGRLVDAHGPRAVMITGTVVAVVMYVLMSQVQELWQFVLVLAALAFFQVWYFYIPLTSIVARWFSRRRGAAMAITTSGFGIGSLLFVPLQVWAVSLLGWRESFLLAAVMTAAVNGLFLATFPSDPKVGWQERDEFPAATPSDNEEALVHLGSTRELFRTPAFWLLSLGFSAFFLGQWGFLFHALPFFESNGASAGEAAAIMSGSAGLGVILRLGAGMAVDRLRMREQLAATALFVMSAAMVLLILNASLVGILVFVMLWGIGSGIAPLLQPLLIARLFGMRYYARAYGISDSMDTTGVIVGTWLGVLFVEVTGRYELLLFACGLTFLLGSMSLAVLSVVVGRRMPDRPRFGAVKAAPLT